VVQKVILIKSTKWINFIFMFKQKLMYIFIIVGIIGGVLLGKLIFGNASMAAANSLLPLLVIILLIIGAILAIKYKWLGSSTHTETNSSVLLQKIEKVFKVVTAEGYFSEVFDYSQTTKVINLIPSTKKALLIVNAKVLMGFDFKKAKFEVNENGKILKCTQMPPAEVLSIEPDIKYYNIDNGLFNKFDNTDLTKLQQEAKQKILDKIPQSELPTIANTQLKQLMQEVASLNNWQLAPANEGQNLIN
jgi:hypothetical protein